MRADRCTVVRGGVVVTPDGQGVRDLVIAGGRVAALEDAGTARADEIIDARGLVVIPGVVDMHVHLREPGLTHKDDVASGTRAAACGGTTTVCDMPNTLPPVATRERFREKMEGIGRSCWVDVGLWAGGTSISELEFMHAEGAVGIKIYMVSGHGFEELYTGDAATLTRIMDTAARLDWLVCAHVGDEAKTQRERAAMIAANRRDAWAFVELQRGEGSLAGLRRFLDAARRSRAHAHVAHLSVHGVAALEMVRAYRRLGLDVTVETQLPALGSADLERLGIFALASGQDDGSADVFWQALATGEVDVSATDHAPHTKEEKAPGRDDIWAAPPGYPALETALPIAFDAVIRGRWSLARMVDAMADRPAMLLGLSEKGELSVGRDADIVLLDPSKDWRVDERRLHSKVGWSPFHGRELRGRVHSTFLRGELIAKNGEVVGAMPIGRLIRSRSLPTAPCAS